MTERVWTLANPGGGRGRTSKFLVQLRAHAERSGVRFLLSESTEDLARHARAAAAAGVERLLVAGGDGTLHHAIQGLAGSATALGILPLGSGNDLAGTLGVPEALDRALELGMHGAIERIDLVRAGGRYYGGVAGVGFDSEVNRYANERVKWIKGKLIYPYATLRWILPFRAPVLRVEHDAGTFEGPAMFAVLANSPRYGGGMFIAPTADLQDGLLDLVIVRKISKLQLLMVFPRSSRAPT